MNRKNLLALIICLTSGICSAANSGELKHIRKTQRITYRPMKWTARAKAGYPWGTAAANVTGLATGVPVALAFGVLKFITRPTQSR